MRDLDLTHPAIADLRRTAKRRLPKFAFEYLDSGTGSELGVIRNRQALDQVLFMPAILRGAITADLATRFMGDSYALPIGVAPVGMSGMIWPRAEQILAASARDANIPYCQSTVATIAPEDNAANIGDIGWFQHYPVARPEVRRDMLKRIRAAGFRKLVMTVDIPGESRRERQRRAHISLPPKITPSILWSMILHPHWSIATALNGTPRLKFPEDYSPATGQRSYVQAGKLIRGFPDWDYLRALRDDWGGDLLVKGVMEPEDAQRMVQDEGVDGIWVSNHSARQFEGGPSPLVQLPKVRAALGPDVPIVFDSGVGGGLDVMRALALGADFVFLGRAFHYAVAAFQRRGVDHLIHVLTADLQSNMAQIGLRSLGDLPDRLVGAEG